MVKTTKYESHDSDAVVYEFVDYILKVEIKINLLVTTMSIVNITVITTYYIKKCSTTKILP